VKPMLAPSIMCADLLNLEREIRLLEEAKVELIHFDVMDTTFTTTTMLPPMLISAINKITNIPVDIHVMIDKPQRIIDYLLPYCKGNYISFHTETTIELMGLIKKAKDAGAKVGAALNYATSLSAIEEVLPSLDFLLLILGNGGTGPRIDLDAQLLHKISRARKMLDDAGCEHVPISVDGGVSFEVAKKTMEMGANIFVLGTKSIYNKENSVVEQCNAFRAYLS